MDEDDAGARIESSAGNLLTRLEPTVAEGLPIFLCAHLDTVRSGGADRAGGRGRRRAQRRPARSWARTTRRRSRRCSRRPRACQEEGRPHAGIELLFTPKEEVGLLGAKAFDHGGCGPRVGFVYDQASPIGEVVLGAPTQRSLLVRFHGRAAHSGMYPEEGRSAIAAAARAIADLRLGRIDAETTANVGVVHGGTARNIVPEWCSFELEIRAHDERRGAELVQEALDTITFAAAEGECEVETQLEESYRGYRFRRDDRPVRLAARALERCGIEPRYVLTGGGADANVFNAAGLACLNLANGMVDIHTPDERIAVEDLERMVDVTLALVDAACGAPVA